MKKVFSSNSELAHVYAQFNQSYGQNPQRSMFFENNTIYSYGYHFPIASKVDNDGYDLILLTSDSYGSATGKHISHVSSALSHYNRILISGDTIDIYNNQYMELKHKKTQYRKERDYQIKQLIGLYCTQKRARVADYSPQINAAINNIKSLCEFFKISASPLETMLENPDYAVEKVQKKMSADKEKEIKKQNEKLKKWLNGESAGNLYGITPHLRAVYNADNIPQTVETSHGAKITYTEAEQLAELYQVATQQLDDTEASYCTFSSAVKFGYYAIDKIQRDGVMKAGCHTFTKKVLESFIDVNVWRISKESAGKLYASKYQSVIKVHHDT